MFSGNHNTNASIPKGFFGLLTQHFFFVFGGNIARTNQQTTKVTDINDDLMQEVCNQCPMFPEWANQPQGSW